MNKILLLLAATLIALPAADGAAGAGKHHRGELRERVLAKHDADGDGKLSDAERTAAKAACKARFAEKKAEFDTDSDGKLSESERAAMRAAISARIKAKHPELFARIDADGNGEISRDEAQAAGKARHEHRGERRGATGE